MKSSKVGSQSVRIFEQCGDGLVEPLKEQGRPVEPDNVSYRNIQKAEQTPSTSKAD